MSTFFKVIMASKKQNTTLSGLIVAHGATINKGNYVIIPDGITLIFLERCGVNLNLQSLSIDKELFSDRDTRKYLLSSEFENHLPGTLVPDMILNFKVTWNNGQDTENGVMTGIITSGIFNSDLVHLKEFHNNRSRFKNELMRSHDSSIIPIDEIWNKSMTLSSILKLLVKKNKKGVYTCICCRGVPDGEKMEYENYMIQRFTTSFNERMTSIQQMISTKSSIQILNVETSQIKSDLILNETLLFMNFYRDNGIISDTQLSNIIDVIEHKKISYAYLCYIIENNLVKLRTKLYPHSNNTDISKITYQFLLIVLKNVPKFLSSTFEGTPCHGIPIDNLIIVCNCIIDNVSISPNLTNYILRCVKTLLKKA